MAEEDRVQAARLEARIDRYREELVAFLARRAPNDAEELAQEVWLRVARAAPHCPDDASFRAYTYTVARRLLVDHHRRRSARVQLVSLERDSAATGSDPESPRRLADILTVVEGELSEMKPEIAEVFRMRMTEEVSFQEIADHQGVPINTALGRMHRATRRIADALARAGLLPRRLEDE